ncbi:MAG: D-2-hydroxyacid dehydrogenase family protein [Candidatus Nanopelagicales bacterium]|nr:D-2-hydroxyacid dehydrogenase family protein [Candidatus Nanopelagicales bacterium]
MSSPPTPSARLRIAVLDDYQHAALGSADFGVLAGIADIVVFADHVGDPDQLALRLAGFPVIIAMRERTAFSAGVLDRLPDLRLLITTGMANASIDVQHARLLGIDVCGTAIGGTATQELVWALIMALARHIPTEDAGVRAGSWQTTLGRELAGSTLGLLGLGRIGSSVAAFGHAFDMHVIAWSENLTPARVQEHGAELVTKHDLFARSDIVSIHVRESPRTVGLVGTQELDLLGPNGLLVNTSRGPIVDEAALVAALHEGRIAGAALDVYDVEPLPPGHPLLTAPNTVLTPHIGYVSASTYARMYADAIDDVLAWVAGAPVRLLNGGT